MSIDDWYSNHGYAEYSDPTYDRANDDSIDPFEFGSIPATREHAAWGKPSQQVKAGGRRTSQTAMTPTTPSGATRAKTQAAMSKSMAPSGSRTVPIEREALAEVVRWLQLSPQGATADCLAALRLKGLAASTSMIKAERKRLLSIQVRAPSIRPKAPTKRTPRGPSIKRKIGGLKAAKRVKRSPGTPVQPVPRPSSTPRDSDRCQACGLVPTSEGNCRCS